MPTITPIQDQEVKITEQGELITSEDTATAVGAGTQDQVSFTVPTGKKWVVKGINGEVSAGSLSEIFAKIRPQGTMTFAIPQALFGTLAASNSYLFNNNLTLVAGDVVTIFTKSASAGNHTKILLYVELDA